LRNKVRVFHLFFQKVVILPTTYAMPGIHKVYFFARDRFDSMEFVPNAVFCHDLAFYLDVKSKKK
jgi:hypothetical protein